MHLRQLKSFVTVCREGSVSRSAQILHLSQPALSRQLQELESEIGCALFSRINHRLALTPAGLAFEIRAREILHMAEMATTEALSATQGLTGTVRVGCVESNASQTLAVRTADWMRLYPNAVIELYSADGDDLRRALDEGSLDMALLVEPVEVAKYDTLPYPVSDRWGLAVREDAIPSDMDRVSAAEVARFRLIFPRRRIVKADLAQWLNVPEAQIHIAATVNLPTNALQLVQAGVGAHVCIEGALAIRPMDGIRFLPFEPLKQSSHCLVRRRNKELSQLSELFWTYAAGPLSAQADPEAEPAE